MSETLTVDINDMTLGEMDDFERESGMLAAELQEKPLTAKALIALVWISQRRTNPKFTLKDARKVQVSSINLGTDPTAAKPEETT